MSTLFGQERRDTYKSLLKLDDFDGLSATLQAVSDGAGNNTPIQLSTNTVKLNSTTSKILLTETLLASVPSTPDAGGVYVYVKDSDKHLYLKDSTGTETDLMAASASSLATLSDVTLGALSDNNILGYDTGTGEWINQTASQLGLVPTSRTVTAGTGMTGGGDLSANITLNCSITQYTDEMARDAIGSLIIDSTTIDAVYIDGSDTLALDVKANSITSAHIDGTDAAAIKTELSLNNVENTALSTWAGSTNITTLGTIVTGTVPAANVSGLTIFKTISVSGQSDVIADSAADTLTLVAGTGVTITTDAGTDSITINSSITQYTNEMAMDAIGAMIIDSNSIDVTYTDGSDQLTIDVKDEYIQDLVGAMVSGNTETLISVTYQDGDGTIDFEITDAELTALAGLTSAANKIPRFTGSGTADLLDFKDEDNMVSDSATAIPSQQSVKAYVDTEIAGVSAGAGISAGKAFILGRLSK